MEKHEAQQIATAIIETGEADREWVEDQPEYSEEFKKGWKRGIDQLVTELLGRKSEDEAEKLKEITQ